MKIEQNLSRALLASLILATISGCAAHDDTTTSASINLAQANLVNGQLTFSDPQLALESLAEAVHTANTTQLSKIFGPQGREILNSGDAATDKANIQKVAELIAQKTEVIALPSPDHSQLAMAGFLFGNNDWPFPVPLVKEGTSWRFDTSAGKEEIINRQIGENELKAVAVCSEFFKAQMEFRDQSSSSKSAYFADRFISSPGKRDGLYWEPQPGEALSPMGPLVAKAAVEGHATNDATITPFNGYYFRILKRQGSNARGGAMDYFSNGKMTKGFALIAYPAKWDVSGSMTYLVGPDGAIYEKNLGPKTETIAAKISSYDPDLSWALVR